MSKCNYPLTASVAVENTAFSFDKLFTYLISDDLAEKASVGCRVLVDFGKSRKKRQGFILGIGESEENTDIKLKPIYDVIDDTPYLTEETAKLALWLADRTFCPVFDCAKALLPSGICLNVIESYRTSSLTDNIDLSDFPEEERLIIEFLDKKDDFVAADKIYDKLKISPDKKILETLCDKGYLLKNVDANRRVGDASVKKAFISGKYESEGLITVKLTAKQQSVIDFLRESGSATVKEISYYTGVTGSVTDKLRSMGILEYKDIEVFRTPEKMRSTPRDNSPIILSDMQNDAYIKLSEKLNSEKPEASLLFGVTGSGKTKVYMRLIDDVAARNGGVIVLVPEISLTPQLLTVFYARYGEKVAVLHSGLSVGERADEWKRIKNGSANIVVGTRSASFAPLENLQLFIIDEEQEGSYKSEMSPRYHARDVAKFRCAYHNALLLLASATPSVETYANALGGRYGLVELTERYSKSGLPTVKTVDMSDRENMNGMRAVSEVLADEMRYNLEHNQQTILLINRRGFNTFVACTKCKNVIMCPNCSISMTYHSANNRLMCHYCGYSEPLRTTCPVCEADTIRFSGFGTQKVASEVESLFPDAKVLRMDADTTVAKNSHDKYFSQFANGEYDIMVGTQMVAKGLDFPNVTLVGVISVDQQLYNDDYKSTERVFDLLTQVVGRSGRGEESGRAVIQTLAPENAVIELAADQDYKSFFDAEIMIRRGMIYPPYCDLCVVSFSGVGELNVHSAAKEFFRLFKNQIDGEHSDEKVVVLGPVPPKISKINNRHRDRIIIKCKNSKRFRKIISDCLKELSTNKKYNNITAFADMNPESIF